MYNLPRTDPGIIGSIRRAAFEDRPWQRAVDDKACLSGVTIRGNGFSLEKSLLSRAWAITAWANFLTASYIYIYIYIYIGNVALAANGRKNIDGLSYFWLANYSEHRVPWHVQFRAPLWPINYANNSILSLSLSLSIGSVTLFLPVRTWNYFHYTARIRSFVGKSVCPVPLIFIWLSTWARPINWISNAPTFQLKSY